ncbi:hypothetical protein LAG90_15620 [Marinilongibacter aquaticus]|uniref:DUF6712 family protein n=1 Tax=Marinilongibacter aquaticus TaxID=2975157 RepID=UPI0021BD324E|nr:DUF6712 family protein [Marinilongibacter aquaticus]UBM58232.1 hypothetical protein LAG90_15620 [Marinilongibacter aquaticus]
MIFKNVEQLKDYLGGIQRNMNWATWKAFVREAEEFFVLEILGADFLDELSEFISESGLDFVTEVSPKKKRAIDLLRISLAAYTDAVGTFRLIMTTGDSGKNFQTPPNTQAPTKWATIGSLQTAIGRGDMAMEKLIAYLEKNAADFETWKSSENYTILKSAFVSSAIVLTEHFPFAENSRRLFLSLKSEFAKAQGRYLSGIISAEFNNALQARLVSDDLETEEKEAIKKIAAVVALKGVSEGVTFLNINENWRLVSTYDGIQSEMVLPESRRNEISIQVSNALELAKNELVKFLQEKASEDVFSEYFNSSLYAARIEKPSTRFVNKKERKYAIL